MLGNAAEWVADDYVHHSHLDRFGFTADGRLAAARRQDDEGGPGWLLELPSYPLSKRFTL